MKDNLLVVTPMDRPSAAYKLRPLYRDAFTGRGSLVRLVRGSDGKVDGLRAAQSYRALVIQRTKMAMRGDQLTRDG